MNTRNKNPAAESDEPLVDSKIVAPLLGIKDRTVRKWGETGILPCYKVGSCLKFRMSEVKEWIAQNRSPSKEEIRRELEAEKENRKEHKDA